MKRQRALFVTVLLAAAFAMTALCSMSSPLYPTNIWGDANCLLTVGRAMRAGRVLYRDIYEQKGPLLYFAHMLCACVSDTSFFGVYLMESLCCFAFLLAAVRFLRRRVGRAALPGALLIAACILSSGTFVRGDSAEEFCLPLAMAALCVFDGGAQKGAMSLARLFVLGLLAGLVAAVKFTLLGIFLGLCLAAGLMALRRGGMRLAGKSAGVFLLGMALPVLPWMLYFLSRGALPDFLTAYVYNNIFLYAGEARMNLREWAQSFRQGILWALPCLIGLPFFLSDRKEPGFARLGAGAAFCLQLMAVLLPGRVWQYSALAVSPFAVWGVLPAARGIRAALCRLRAKGILPPAGRGILSFAISAALSFTLCGFATPNAFLRGVSLSDTAQGRLAEKIPKGSSLLQYKFLDDGLYLACGAIPEEKYFVLLNVRLLEMRDALDEAVDEGRPDYVLTSYDPLPKRFSRYELVATDLGFLDSNRPRKDLYLYRRKEGGGGD